MNANEGYGNLKRKTARIPVLAKNSPMRRVSCVQAKSRKPKALISNERKEKERKSRVRSFRWVRGFVRSRTTHSTARFRRKTHFETRNDRFRAVSFPVVKVEFSINVKRRGIFCKRQTPIHVENHVFPFLVVANAAFNRKISGTCAKALRRMRLTFGRNSNLTRHRASENTVNVFNA